MVRSVGCLDKKSLRDTRPGIGTVSQSEFINMMINHLTAHGTMDARLLYESPFTDKNPMGLTGMFGPDAPTVVSILDDVRRRAVA
jgi:type I restriction enzyme R subunit